jgi:methoxymalonate biosynthesis protein
MLCPEVAQEHGGLGFTSEQSGEFTAHLGSLCGSLRSLLTSQGMAAWALQRFGSWEQRATYLPRLTSGALVGVAFSEPAAGSDLSGMATTICPEGDTMTVNGHKVWVTGGSYADLLVIFGRYESGAGAVIVPVDVPGVRVERVADPLGCRAAGHAGVWLDSVRLPADSLLPGAGQPLMLLVTSVLTHGRLSVAWGCVGILRACLTATVRHASTREQFGKPLSQHQLIRRHLAEILVAEQAATRVCEYASRCWDAGTPELVMAAVVAKHIAAGHAARAAASAVQVLGSAGAHDSHPVARAYRDAKLMEIIEGSNEICQLMLSDHALAVWS